MTAKEYLSQARMLDAHIDGKYEQVARLRALIERGRSSVLTGMPRGGNGADWTDTVTRIVALEDEINAGIDRLVDLKREILDTIAAVPDVRHRTLLELRYISGWGWARIAEEMRYDRVWLWRMHGRALEHVNEIRNTKQHSNVI